MGAVLLGLVVLWAIYRPRPAPYGCEVCEQLEGPTLHLEIVVTIPDDSDYILPNHKAEIILESIGDVLSDAKMEWVMTPHYKAKEMV